ncbi:MAG TPA: ribonuclease P [Methanosarcinales archaeon]|nr:ribonuclease P [Methanosarcinales archaeon]
MTRRQKKKWIKEIARQQIERLFELAEMVSRTRPLLSDRYIHLAKRIGMRNRVRIPTHLKRRMCKHCGKYLIPGRTCRVRLNGTCVVVTCLACNKQTRYPYYRRQNPPNDRIKHQNRTP